VTEKGGQIEFNIGDRVVSLDTNEKGTVTRLGGDKDIILIRWDASKMQEMVEAKTLRKE